MAVAVRTVTVNAAFLREIKEDHRDLWRLLREVHDLCRTVAPAAPRKQLADALSELRDRLAMHFALEEAYGYFDDPLEASPRLSRQAEDLRSQHEGLFLEFCRLADEADALAHEHASASRSRRIAIDYLRLHEELEAHEQAENRLIMDAFEQDLGVGD